MIENVIPQAPTRRLRHGAMSARERMEAFFDAGTFVEWGAEVEPVPQSFGPQPTDARGDGVIAGIGEVDGRITFAYAMDFSVLEGTLGERGAQKIVDLMDRAVDAGAPLVAMLHSNGARLSEGVGSLEGATAVFHRYIVYSGRIPLVAVAMGFCSGFPAYLASLSDVVIMVERSSFLVTTSPAVIRAATGQSVRLPELGGAKTHAEISGVAHRTAPNEADALAQTREVLSYLDARCTRPARSPLGPMPELPKHPAHAYDVVPHIQGLADGGDFCELWPRWAKNVVTGFIRLGGRSVGVIANQPAVDCGAVTTRSARKMTRFVKLCDAFGLPLVFLVDVPGILPGVEPEHDGILIEGANFYKALNTDVPRLTVVTRKCYGGAYGLLNSKQGGGSVVFAYPQAKIGVAGAEIAMQILGGKDDESALERLGAEWAERGSSALAAAQRGIVDRIIEPRHTRDELLGALRMFPSRSPASRLRRSGWQ